MDTDANRHCALAVAGRCRRRDARDRFETQQEATDVGLCELTGIFRSAPSTRRLLAYIAALVERNNNNPTTIWHDELETVGSRSVIGPGLRELTALGFITRTLDIKRSTFALADQWQSSVSATRC